MPRPGCPIRSPSPISIDAATPPPLPASPLCRATPARPLRRHPLLPLPPCDGAAVVDLSDAYIRNLLRQLDTVCAEADVASIADEQSAVLSTSATPQFSLLSQSFILDAKADTMRRWCWIFILARSMQASATELRDRVDVGWKQWMGKSLISVLGRVEKVFDFCINAPWIQGFRFQQLKRSWK